MSENSEKKQGWIFKTDADYLIYAVPKFVYMIELKELRKQLKENLEKIKGQKRIVAYNKEGDYYTHNKKISWEDIKHKKYEF